MVTDSPTIASNAQAAISRAEVTRSEALAILIAERRDSAQDKMTRGLILVGILGLLLFVVPDKADFSLEIGKVKLDKLVGQKEVLCLVTAIMLQRFAAELSKVVYYLNIYKYRLDIDFKDQSTVFVSFVADEKLPLVFTDDEGAERWFFRFENVRTFLAGLIFIFSIGAVFVITAFNIVSLLRSPAAGWPISYVLLGVATAVLFLFLATVFQAINLQFAIKKWQKKDFELATEKWRKKKSDDQSRSSVGEGPSE